MEPVGSRPMAIDSTDASFEDDVLVRSDTVPVLVDLWAPWCGPCKSLSPIIERVVEATGGAVELVKVNIDENPLIAQSFQVQSIPAVFAIRNRQIVDRFIGALGEGAVREFVDKLLPAPSEAEKLLAAGDEASIRRALELEPDLPGAAVALAEILVGRGEPAEALSLLARIRTRARPAVSPLWPVWRSRVAPRRCTPMAPAMNSRSSDTLTRCSSG